MRVAAILLAGFLSALQASSETGGIRSDAESLIEKGLGERRAENDSAAARYFAAALEREPEHAEALWLALELDLERLANTGLLDRAEALADAGPRFERIERAALEQGRGALLHYVRARHALLYRAHETALDEIAAALRVEPESPRFLRARGAILVDRGGWLARDEDIEAGIRELARAQDLARAKSDPYFSIASHHFIRAWAASRSSQPRWPEVIEHYRAAIDAGATGMSLAYAWNNLSVAYRNAGRCAEAKAAAEAALGVAKFGAARSNLRQADFCLDTLASDRGAAAAAPAVSGENTAS